MFDNPLVDLSEDDNTVHMEEENYVNNVTKGEISSQSIPQTNNDTTDTNSNATPMMEVDVDVEERKDLGLSQGSTITEQVPSIPPPARKPIIDRGDQFVLHFYDVAAQKPHTMYRFCRS